MRCSCPAQHGGDGAAREAALPPAPGHRCCDREMNLPEQRSVGNSLTESRQSPRTYSVGVLGFRRDVGARAFVIHTIRY
jgi:hypothetical protein